MGLSAVETPLALYARLTTGADKWAAQRALSRRIEVALSAAVGDALHLAVGEAPTIPSRPPLMARQATIAAADGPVVVRVAPWASAGEWSEGAPPWLQVLCQALLWLSGHSRAYAGVYGAGGAFHVATVYADPSRQEEVVAAAHEFLSRIREKRPPPPTATDLGAVREVFTSDEDGSVKLSREHARQWEVVTRRRKQRRTIEKKLEALETRLRYAIGSHRFGLLPGGRVLRLAVAADGSRRLVEVR